MMRILKRYKLNYHLTSAPDSPPAPGVTVDFSGYPGSITSQDEFYLLQGEQHRLAVTGTALRNYNSKLWKNVNITEQVSEICCGMCMFSKIKFQFTVRIKEKTKKPLLPTVLHKVQVLLGT